MLNEKTLDTLDARLEFLRKYVYRVKNGTQLTLDDVSKETGISRSALSSYENNVKIPGADNLKKLCEFYGVSADWLIGLSQVEIPVRKVSDLTGLSSEAVDALHRLKEIDTPSNITFYKGLEIQIIDRLRVAQLDKEKR